MCVHVRVLGLGLRLPMIKVDSLRHVCNVSYCSHVCDFNGILLCNRIVHSYSNLIIQNYQNDMFVIKANKQF